MSLLYQWIGNFNAFNFVRCPTCDGGEFASLSAAGVWCTTCNTSFQVRDTCGDPGCVVDAATDHVYGPSHTCGKCGRKMPAFGEAPKCLACGGCLTPDPEGVVMDMPKDLIRTYYQILKTHGDCSGWLLSGPSIIAMDAFYSHPSCRDHTLLERWLAFMAREDFWVDKKMLPGGVRFQMVQPGEDSIPTMKAEEKMHIELFEDFGETIGTKTIERFEVEQLADAIRKYSGLKAEGRRVCLDVWLADEPVFELRDTIGKGSQE